MQMTKNPLERKESPSKAFKKKRNEVIVKRFLELCSAGTNKMMAYHTIAGEITPPLDFAQVIRILKKEGAIEEVDKREKELVETA